MPGDRTPIVRQAVRIPCGSLIRGVRGPGHAKPGNTDCYYIPVIAIFAGGQQGSRASDRQRERTRSAFVRWSSRCVSDVQLTVHLSQQTTDCYGKQPNTHRQRTTNVCIPDDDVRSFRLSARLFSTVYLQTLSWRETTDTRSPLVADFSSLQKSVGTQWLVQLILTDFDCVSIPICWIIFFLRAGFLWRERMESMKSVRITCI